MALVQIIKKFHELIQFTFFYLLLLLARVWRACMRDQKMFYHPKNKLSKKNKTSTVLKQ